MLTSMISAVHHISVSIQKPVAAVYEFASNPENLPKWASGLSGAHIHKEGSVWISDSPMGRVKIKFAEKNVYGVMDHDVTIPSGQTTRNAFRVIPNGDGSEVVFSALQEKMTDEQFSKDTATIKKDLETLKSKLEAK